MRAVGKESLPTYLMLAGKCGSFYEGVRQAGWSALSDLAMSEGGRGRGGGDVW